MSNYMTKRQIFVFGSNLAGRHGKGAALDARLMHGAITGKGEGLQGNSYAIPSKNYVLKPLPLSIIEDHVRDFIDFATRHPELEFNVTRVGCGLAGYTNEQIAPFFEDVPDNVKLPKEWEAWRLNEV